MLSSPAQLHVPDGFLTTTVSLVLWALSVLVIAVSLRRVGNDVEGDGSDAKLARAEAALDAGDLPKAVALVKSLPPQTARATAGWLSRAGAHLAAKQAADQISSQAVTLLGAAR